MNERGSRKRCSSSNDISLLNSIANLPSTRGNTFFLYVNLANIIHKPRKFLSLTSHFLYVNLAKFIGKPIKFKGSTSQILRLHPAFPFTRTQKGCGIPPAALLKRARTSDLQLTSAQDNALNRYRIGVKNNAISNFTSRNRAALIGNTHRKSGVQGCCT